MTVSLLKSFSLSRTQVIVFILFFSFCKLAICQDLISPIDSKPADLPLTQEAPVTSSDFQELNLSLTQESHESPSTGYDSEKSAEPLPQESPVDASPSTDTQKADRTYSKIQPIIEAKVGYFIFADAKMRKIYNKGGVDYQISGSYPIWRWLQVYGSVEYFQRSGKSLNGHQKTKIWQIPVSIGLKPVVRICPEVHYYLTLGPRYFYVHQHNHSSYVNRNISHSGVGGFVNTGFNFFPLRNLVLDVVGEYSYQRMHFHSSKTNVYDRSVQVGGYSVGIGIGYVF